MMNGLQSLDQWKSAFNNPTAGMLGLLNAIQNIGCLAAYPFSPYVSDGYGRKTAVALGAFIMCGATILQTASHSVGMFIGARFMIGFGLTFAASAAPVLVTEIAYPSQRGPVTSCYNALWYACMITCQYPMALTIAMISQVLGQYNCCMDDVRNLPYPYKLVMAYSFCPSSTTICLSSMPNLVRSGVSALVMLQGQVSSMIPLVGADVVSDDPRREAEALNILAYYHGNGDRSHPLVEYEFEEIRTAIALDREAENVGWLTLIKTPGNRRRLRIMIAIAFFSQWSGNNLISYYMNKTLTAIGVVDPTTQLLINGILNIFNFVIATTAGLLCDRIGRRPLFIASTIGMFVFWTLQTVCFALYSVHGNIAAAHTFIAMIFLFYAFYDIAFTPLIASYTIEILPFSIRAKGYTVFSFTVTLSLIFNQYVNPIALQALGWKYYIVYVCWLAFEVVFMFVYVVETKNRTLEETAALFDGEDSVKRLAADAAREAGINVNSDHSEKDKASDHIIEEVKM
ncbi:hypothetical protein EW026_g4236 [Hermanssonia centrifuga]|uniref:Major facilitator superfamily (MFS) profile domain-containing protein n=1 Tax=Hermanssonia centrifuga TaxID=98765 RepID=A0A4S4KJK7_9APHY|nr:hypothetical protein EW026_g4236 [Hermanssonia centrifuga]